MGCSSIISNTAPSDGAFQNEACKYYEVDQTVFEEKLVPRGKESGRHLLSSESQRPEEPGTELIDSTDDEPEEVPRERSSSHSLSKKHQSHVRKLSRSPPRDRQDCVSTAPTNRSTRKTSNTSSRSRNHSLAVDARIPGFISSRKSKPSARRLKERAFSPDRSFKFLNCLLANLNYHPQKFLILNYENFSEA
jgi:hypothetical protein